MDIFCSGMLIHDEIIRSPNLKKTPRDKYSFKLTVKWNGVMIFYAQDYIETISFGMVEDTGVPGKRPPTFGNKTGSQSHFPE